MKQKTIRYLGHNWIIEGGSSLGSKFVQLRRKSWKSDFIRYGQVATVIDAPITILQK